MSHFPEPRIDIVVRRLRAAMPRQWPEISLATGVPEKTICKIAYRETLDPRTSTTEALYNYFIYGAAAGQANERSASAGADLDAQQKQAADARPGVDREA